MRLNIGCLKHGKSFKQEQMKTSERAKLYVQT